MGRNRRGKARISRGRKSQVGGEHACQLPELETETETETERETRKSNLPRLPPNAKVLSRLKRNVQKLIIVSEKHPSTKFFLRSRAAVAFERKRHAGSANWWIVHPLSDFRFAWEILMILVWVYLLIAVSYVYAFRLLSVGEIVDEVLFYLCPAYGICLLDILANFFTGFISDNGHEIFLDPWLVARHYGRGYFLIDLISSVPYALMTRPSPSSLTKIHRRFRFTTMTITESLAFFKFFRIGTLRRYVDKLSAGLGMSEIGASVIWYSLLSSLILHWSACIVYASCATLQDSEVRTARIGLYGAATSAAAAATWRTYVTSLHVGVSDLVGSSFMESNQTSSVAEKITRSLLRISGTAYTIHLLVIVLQLTESSARPELRYRETIHRIGEYILEKKLPKRLRQRLIDYYEYRFQAGYFGEKIVASNILSDDLKREIGTRSTPGFPETATIFRNLPRALLSSLIASSKPVIYLEDDVVFECGTTGDCMYFIANGTVAVIDSLGVEICHLEEGNYFGVAGLIYPQRPREVSVVALRLCELLRLDRRDFESLVGPNAELYSRLARSTT